MKRRRITPGEVAAAHNAEARASASPKMQSLMDEVKAAVDAEAALMDAQLDGENKLRQWAKQLCGTALDISEIENLRDIVARMKKGQTERFYPKRGDYITLFKSSFGTIDKLENYMFALEKAVIDLSQGKTPIPFNFTSVRVLGFTQVSRFGLIKLAFQRFFTRSK